MAIRKILACAAALLAISALAEDYQFIVSGYPAANVSYPAESAAIPIETATRNGPTAAQALEARCRTWDESDGIPLRTDKFRATMIIVR